MARAWLSAADDDDPEVPVLIGQVRAATVALTHATAATATDQMLVPEEIATAWATCSPST